MIGWQDDAACRGMNQKFFFSPSGAPPTVEARRACAWCPVKADCLDEAIRVEKLGDMYGYRAGMTVEQRAGAIRRARGEGRRLGWEASRLEAARRA